MSAYIHRELSRYYLRSSEILKMGDWHSNSFDFGTPLYVSMVTDHEWVIILECNSVLSALVQTTTVIRLWLALSLKYQLDRKKNLLANSLYSSYKDNNIPKPKRPFKKKSNLIGAMWSYDNLTIFGKISKKVEYC